MSEPKISRRCPACGASIRERAFFCPQCGRALEDSGVGPAAVPTTTPLTEPQSLQAENLNDTLVERAPPRSSDKTQRPDRRRRNQGRRGGADAIPEGSSIPGQIEAQVDAGKVRAGTAVVRDAGERNVLQRVAKLRKVSSVVIDEATYDPSLRFILVAAVLFILFLVIVILNKIIG
jgi:hypothetical protein